MALTFVKYNTAIADAWNGIHALVSDTTKFALSNTTPSVTHETLANASEIAAGNGYTAGGNAVTITSSSQTGGTYTCVGSGTVSWTAVGGSMATFQHIIWNNDDTTGDRLLGSWSEASPITLTEGSSYTLNINTINLISAS
jgi:hypothetical protein